MYEALAALLLGKKTSHTGEEKVDNILSSESPSSPPPYLRSIMLCLQVCLDDFLQSLIDSQAASPAQQLCVEAAVILLELVKALITQVIMWKVHIFALDTTNRYKPMLPILFFVLTAHSCSKTHLRHRCIMGDSAPSKYDAVFLPAPQPQTQRPTVGIGRIPPCTGFCRLPCRSFRGLPTFWTSKAVTIITCRLIFYLFTYFRLSLAQQVRETTQSAVSQNRSRCGTLSVFCWWTASLTFLPIRRHILSFCCWRWKCIYAGI